MARTLYDWQASAPKRIPQQLPPKEYMMGNLHIVDLTKTLDPNTETRRCRLWRFNTGGSIPDFHTLMDLTSHLGTHCECPYHHDEDWPSVAEENHLGAKIRPGDTVIIDSPYRIPPFTPATNGPTDHRLHVGAESAQWLCDHGVQSVGFGDGVTIEDYEVNVKPFHDILMAKNCTFLEVLQNLDLLRTDTFFISYAPLPIVGLDSCPVRAYAIEGLSEFSK